MNTVDIIQCLKKIARNKFKYGVFASDRLPVNIKKPALIVANTDPSQKPGTHWVAFYLPKRGKCEYFDSYGRAPLNKNFVKFLQSHHQKFDFNRMRLQSDFSTLCGQYCCVYLYSKSKNTSLRTFLNKFEKNKQIYNDEKIERLFKKYFKTSNQVGSGVNNLQCNQVCKPKKYKRT